VFVGLEAAASESGDAWEGFLTGLGERGLACPLLVISDGAPGLIGAVERTMGAALRQRCLIHRCRNVVSKISKNAQTQVKADYWTIFDVPEDMAPGLDAVAYVQKRIDSFAARWRESYPGAVRALLADRESLTVYLRFPREHWTRVRVEGGYEWLARRLFPRIRAERLLLEYDDERSGGFEPLAAVPQDKTVVLGLVTTKTRRQETIHELQMRIREAARHMPLERLALSAQCGFATSILGNAVTAADQETKLRTIVATAERVWG
jgi:hypothetical protein